MLKKLLIAVGAVVLIALMWWQGSTVDLIPDLAPKAATGGEATPSGPGRNRAPAAGGPTANRVAAGAGAEPAVAPSVDPPARRVETLRLLVVDGKGDPVPEAEVAVFEAQDRRRGLSLWAALTDAVGRAQLEVAVPVLVSASKVGVGWSGDVHVERASGLTDEQRIVLLPTAIVHGTVRLPDGGPAASVRVRGRTSQSDPVRSGELPLRVTDADGAFVFEVLAGREYSFSARWEGRDSGGGTVSELLPGQRFELTLRFLRR